MTDGHKYGRNWCFTINNPTMDPAALLERFSGGNVKYGIFQTEYPKGGTKHYQGYIELAHSIRFKTVEKLLGGHAHIERRLGSASQARDYCRKDEDRLDGPYEHGVFTERKPGNRSDLHDAVAELAIHRDLSTLADNRGATFIRYHRGFAKYLEVTAGKRIRPPQVSLYFGPTGTGKTRKAYGDNTELFRKHPDTRWFDGLGEEDTVLLDDFNGATSKMSLNYILQLLDRYPFTVEVKGGHKNLLATNIIVTTNNHPYTWYDYSTREENYRALARRFHRVIYFGEDRPAFELDKDKFFGTGPYGASQPTDYWSIRKIVPESAEESEDLFDYEEEDERMSGDTQPIDLTYEFDNTMNDSEDHECIGCSPPTSYRPGLKRTRRYIDLDEYDEEMQPLKKRHRK